MRAIGRAALRGAVSGALALGLVGASMQTAAAAEVVYMDRVVVQSMVEPVYGQTNLAGNSGVEQVQKALRAKGYGTTVDGWYGTGTRSDYSAWQRDLGYSGLGANGIPGPTSLTKLGSGRFDVQREVLVGSKTSYSGHTVNQRTRNMLSEARSKHSWSITVTQGSYRGCSSASACTHAGGGAVDISVNWSGDSSYNLTGTEEYRAWRTVKALRQVGFAAWLRTPSQSNWPYHIHAIAIGDTDAHTEAADQVADYYKGKNGLASHGSDNTPSEFRVPFVWWEWYKRKN